MNTKTQASQRDQLLQAALDFVGTLTGMSPPPIEVAPPEVFAPFYAFVDRVQAITAPQPQADKPSSRLGIPPECPHIIWYDDRDRKLEIFAGDGAKEAAERRFEQISDSWNAHLFVSIAAKSRDCPYPLATVAAPQPQADERDAAFEAVRNKLCKLQRYSFITGGAGGGVQRIKDRCGNWIEFDAAHELFDPIAIDAAITAAKEKQ